VSDENFGKLVSGKANAQQLFMSGKLKIKGNAMKVSSVIDPGICCDAADSMQGSEAGTHPQEGAE
jgi:putative sterol carrier protein